MAGGLSIELEEEVQLVENAATASLFSPGMWVQRPQRTPAVAARDAELVYQCSMAAPLERDHVGLGSPLTDPDLAYLRIADERESAEKEYIKQDSEHMEALEEAYARLQEHNRTMERQLKGVVAAVNDVMDENRTIKQLLAMLQVRREDFVFNPQQTIAAQQEAIGLRLLRNLEGSPPGAVPAAPQQQQQQQQISAASAGVPAVAPSQQQQQQQQEADAGLCPEAWQQSKPQQQPRSAPLLAGPTALDMSPDCLLPLSTPNGLLRTASPKIGAHRFDGGGTEGPYVGMQQQLQPPPTVIPASPYDFPAESQIAAAALTAKQGDTAAALLSLLDKAIEGRVERQQQAQHIMQQVQAAQQQQEDDDGGQQQQQERQTYRL